MTLSGFKEFYFRQAIFLNGIQGAHAKLPAMEITAVIFRISKKIFFGASLILSNWYYKR